MARDVLTSPYSLDQEMRANPDDRNDAGRLSTYFDGVFKGDYSLAMVNRHLAEALVKCGVDLACFSHDADWQADPLLNDMPVVRERMRRAPPLNEVFDVHVRNTWPPTTKDMIGRFNAYVCFAWEETEFPAQFVERFNRDLDLVMVASTFVRNALIDSGVTIPIEVIGEGADHVVKYASGVPRDPHAKARLLHVSSGFPRKGVDCLIAAYHQSFTAGDNVELVIKTFSNPDNVIPRLVAESGASPEQPPIQIIEASYSYAQLLNLYQTATAVVAPSRGEGFGLPLAEAMFMGVPVVTTNYSGQIDFCRPNNSWLVDYSLSRSKAHVSGPFSLWADPHVGHLGQQMRAVLTEASEVTKRAVAAKAFVQEHLTWMKCASRALFAISKHRSRGSRSQVPQPEKSSPISIEVVTSWGTNCGIATYASHLYRGTALSQHVSALLAQKHDANPFESPHDGRVYRIWGDNYQTMLALGSRIEQGAADVLWMQHHPGHFSTPDMLLLTQHMKKSGYKARVITLHSVAEAARGGSLAWCNDFDIAFVHSSEDAEALSKAGHRNPVVVPHGLLPMSSTERSAEKPNFDIGSFGFLTPHKNIDLLISAFALARRFAKNLRLHLFNCVLPNDTARAVQATAESLIRHHGLTDVVGRNYEFIPEDRLLSELSRCDLFVFPYGPTTETATGAARIALSANKPILCSQAAVLRDLHPVSHVLKELSTECLAEALVSLSQCDELLSLYDSQREDFLQRFSYQRASSRYLKHIMRVLEGRREHRYAA